MLSGIRNIHDPKESSTYQNPSICPWQHLGRDGLELNKIRVISGTFRSWAPVQLMQSRLTIWKIHEFWSLLSSFVDSFWFYHKQLSSGWPPSRTPNLNPTLALLIYSSRGNPDCKLNVRFDHGNSAVSLHRLLRGKSWFPADMPQIAWYSVAVATRPYTKVRKNHLVQSDSVVLLSNLFEPCPVVQISMLMEEFAEFIFMRESDDEALFKKTNISTTTTTTTQKTNCSDVTDSCGTSSIFLSITTCSCVFCQSTAIGIHNMGSTALGGFTSENVKKKTGWILVFWIYNHGRGMLAHIIHGTPG